MRTPIVCRSTAQCLSAGVCYNKKCILYYFVHHFKSWNKLRKKECLFYQNKIQHFFWTGHLLNSFVYGTCTMPGIHAVHIYKIASVSQTAPTVFMSVFQSLANPLTVMQNSVIRTAYTLCIVSEPQHTSRFAQSFQLNCAQRFCTHRDYTFLPVSYITFLYIDN